MAIGEVLECDHFCCEHICVATANIQDHAKDKDFEQDGFRSNVSIKFADNGHLSSLFA